MNRKQDLRYDPLYRVIDMTEEIRFIEGKFKKEIDRLKGINNLGIIPEILEMAKYPKYEHHLGTVFQVNSFLERVDVKKEYQVPLQLSALFMHLGHFPFTYSAERALLFACYKENQRSNKARKYVQDRVRKALHAAGLEKEEQQEHERKIFALESFKFLYKYFSCEIFLKNWKKVKRKFRLEDEQKEIIIRNLIDSKNDGYKYLELADKADFVQRDALYLGTVRLDISPKHLYGPGLPANEPGFSSIDEVMLIENNLAYLRERFYESDKVQWVSRLFEKTVANIILSKNFEMKWLEEYDDSQFKRLITENFRHDGPKANLPGKWITKTRDLLNGTTRFSLIFKLSDISFEKKCNVIDIEHKILQTNGSFRKVSMYPFEKGLLLDVNYSRSPEFLVPPSHRLFVVSLFQDDSKRKSLDLLRVLQQLSKYCSTTHIEKIREGIGRQLSWTGTVRIDNKNVLKAISQALLNIGEKDKPKKGKFLREYTRSIASLRTFDALWNYFENFALFLYPLMKYTGEASNLTGEENVYERFPEFLFSLPLRLLQFKTTKSHLDKIYSMLEDILSRETDNEKRGHAFEALSLIGKMREKRGKFQFLISGLVVTDLSAEKNKRDLGEFDIIEFIIDEKNKPECWIYACSIGDRFKQDNEDQIKKLAERIHRVYPDLVIIPRYVIPTDRAGGDWTPREVETGVGIWGIG
jgi:hypothetical protein